jgi:hypothetical protein
MLKSIFEFIGSSEILKTLLAYLREWDFHQPILASYKVSSSNSCQKLRRDYIKNRYGLPKIITR